VLAGVSLWYAGKSGKTEGELWNWAWRASWIPVVSERAAFVRPAAQLLPPR
jgi:hypothetical protein